MQTNHKKIVKGTHHSTVLNPNRWWFQGVLDQQPSGISIVFVACRRREIIAGRSKKTSLFGDRLDFRASIGYLLSLALSWSSCPRAVPWITNEKGENLWGGLRPPIHVRDNLVTNLFLLLLWAGQPPELRQLPGPAFFLTYTRHLHSTETLTCWDAPMWMNWKVRLAIWRLNMHRHNRFPYESKGNWSVP